MDIPINVFSIVPALRFYIFPIISMPEIYTVRQHIAWSYANLASAHAVIQNGGDKYTRTSYMIRAKLYKGLTLGTMNMRSLLDDEKTKQHFPQTCCYCGKTGKLSLDHLIPKSKDGPDDADNII